MGHVTLTTPLLRVICYQCVGSGLDIAFYLCTKFDRYSFSRYVDMVGAHQNLNGSRDMTSSLSGSIFVVRGLVLATINLRTKHLNSLSLHPLRRHERRKWGGLRY